MILKPISYHLFLVILSFQSISSQYAREDWKDRDSWMHLEELFTLVNLKEGGVAADIGCHEGYLTFHLSKRVGDKGKVFAVDVREDRLDKLKESLSSNNVLNVNTVLGDYDDPKLPNGQLDVIFIVDTYHEIEDYEKMLYHIKSALKPEGKLLILEKLKEEHIGKSRKAQANGHTLSITYVEKELQKAGFKIDIKKTDFGTWNHEEEKQMWVLTAILNR